MIFASNSADISSSFYPTLNSLVLVFNFVLSTARAYVVDAASKRVDIQLSAQIMERVLDLQDRVLLCFSGPGVGRRWAWVERSGSPGRWNDLRRALVASLA